MAMMDWVAGEAENSSNRNWSFSVAKFGAQCSVRSQQHRRRQRLGSRLDRQLQHQYVACDHQRRDHGLLPAGRHRKGVPVGDHGWKHLHRPRNLGEGAGCGLQHRQRNLLRAVFDDHLLPLLRHGQRTRHLEWHPSDVHPAPAGYDELANLYEKEATNLKTWDPSAVRFGPVFCCWWFYWNGSNGADKGNHGGVDFLPWWLNQIKWMDQINGARTLDVFDIHAYADCGPTSGFTNAQLKAATVACAGFYWDPATVNQDTNNTYTTNEEPNPGIPFVIPRMKAMVNEIYPGTPLAFTEWGAGLAANSGTDFSTAIADADTLGVFGREGLSFASRWGGPSSGTPEYPAWKMFTNYDGAHHQFEPLSISATNNGNSALFSSLPR
jgi:hypothetical protein